MRLDKFLLLQHPQLTRSKIQDIIKKNNVVVNGKICTKNSLAIQPQDKVEIIQQSPYVSRGAEKILKAIEHFTIDLKDKIVLDVGASTGGFTDVCLQKGAKKVYALDVGTDQLHPTLKANPKVVNLEQTHFEKINTNTFQEKIDLIVADVSFISLTKLINHITNLGWEKFKGVFLIKPQFELTPKHLRAGKVIHQKHNLLAVDKIKRALVESGAKVIGVVESPILGKKMGNQEYLIYFSK